MKGKGHYQQMMILYVYPQPNEGKVGTKWCIVMFYPQPNEKKGALPANDASLCRPSTKWRKRGYHH